MDAAAATGVRPMATVQHAYRPTQKGHLSLEMGETLVVLKKDESGWWLGRNRFGEVGVFPSTFTQESMPSVRGPMVHKPFAPLQAIAPPPAPPQPILSPAKPPSPPRPPPPTAPPVGAAKPGGATFSLAELGIKEDSDASDSDGEGDGEVGNAELRRQMMDAESEKAMAVERLKSTKSELADVRKEMSMARLQAAALRKATHTVHLRERRLAEELDSARKKLCQQEGGNFESAATDVPAEEVVDRLLQKAEEEIARGQAELRERVARLEAEAAEGGLGGATSSHVKKQMKKVIKALQRTHARKKQLERELKERPYRTSSGEKGAEPAAAPASRSAEPDPALLERVQVAEEKAAAAAARADQSDTHVRELGEKLRSSQEELAAVAHRASEAEQRLEDLDAKERTAAEEGAAALRRAGQAEKHLKSMKEKQRAAEEEAAAAIRRAADAEKQLREMSERQRAAETKEKEAEEARARAEASIREAEKAMAENKQLVQSLRASVDDLTKKYKAEEKRRRRLYNEIQEMKGNIRVYCRLRPPLHGGGVCIHRPADDDQVVAYADPNTGYKMSFEFDRAFADGALQEQIFEEVRPLALSILDGYHVCIFAYGQTGSGKTYTMEGPPDNRGVNYRTVKELFNIVQRTGSKYDHDVQVSVMEIYIDDCFDLLSDTRSKLSVRGTPEGGVWAEGLSLQKVESADHLNVILKHALSTRQTASHDLNEHSSRSHCILSVYTTTTNRTTGDVARGKLHLIDLAGSERISRTGAEGMRKKEAESINTSLFSLKSVMNALMRRDQHVPYRDSMLTRFLSDSLGGHSKSLMFANISPEEQDANETSSTLRFAADVRRVELGKAEADVTGQGAKKGARGRGGR